MQGVLKVLRVGTGELRHPHDIYINLCPTSKLRTSQTRGTKDCKSQRMARNAVSWT